MFKSSYQGGPFVEVFSAQGKDPAAKWKQMGRVQRVFDKSVKSYVYQLEGGTNNTKMQLPKDEKQTLALTQGHLILQIYVPLGVDFSLDVGVTDLSNSKRRIFMSSAHKEISKTPLHARLPLGMMQRAHWLNMSINIGSLVSVVFGATMRSIDLICVSANCKLRKVFTMKHQPYDTTSGIYSPNNEGPNEAIPKACTLNVGTTTQVIDSAVIHQWCDKQQGKQRDVITKSAPQNPALRPKPAPRQARSADTTRKRAMKQKPVASKSPVEQPVIEVRGIAKVNNNSADVFSSDEKKKVEKTQRPSLMDNVQIETPLPIESSTPNPLYLDQINSTGHSEQSPRKERLNSGDVYSEVFPNHQALMHERILEDVSNIQPLPEQVNEDNELHNSPRRRFVEERPYTRKSTPSSNSSNKVYNSKDYEENPFAESDEDLKYRMKALALHNGELDDSFDFSTISSRRSKRSTGVGPPALNLSDDEVPEVLGQDSDSSSSDATVLSHAQELLLSGELGHTSFLHDSVGKGGLINNRAFSPPILYPDELTRQASLSLSHPPPVVVNTETVNTINNTIDEESDSEEELDLLYDPVLNCYFDPKTCKYYELA